MLPPNVWPRLAFTQTRFSHDNPKSRRGSSRSKVALLPSDAWQMQLKLTCLDLSHKPPIAYWTFLSLAAANLRSRRFLEASAPASVSRTKSHHLKLLA
jgi:hypothetical protein